MRILLASLLLAFALPACAANPVPVPITALLKDPGVYDGKIVRITGAAVVRFEGVFVCQSVDEIDGDSARCLSMVSDGIADPLARLAPLHNRLVELTGRFRADQHGHMGAFGGQIVVTDYTILGKHDRGDVPPLPPLP